MSSISAAASSTSSSTGSAGAAAQDCNAPAQAGTFVVYEQVAGEPAPPTGGVIADGTYVVTEVTLYTGAGEPGGPSEGKTEDTLVLAGGAFRENNTFESEKALMTTVFHAGTLSTAGSTFQFTYTCPAVMQAGYGDYSASATQIRFVTHFTATTEYVLERLE